MKLANYLSIRLSAVFILILLVWSVLYFVFQMREIYDGIDEGLNNLKQEFVVEANETPEFIERMEKSDPLNIIVDPISKNEAINFEEIYTTTTVYFKTEDEHEEVRMLNTAFYCQLNDQYYKLCFFTSTVESDDLIKNMLYLLIGLWIGLGIALLVTVKRIITVTNKPFYKVLNDLHEFRLDNSQMITFPETNISDYNDLNNSLKMLLTENIEAYTNQKNFIENASHELQTPLAITINRLEVLMNKEKENEELLESLNTVLENLNRMKRINSSLLLLSKINNKQYKESEEVDLSALFEKVADSFSDLIEYKGLTMHIEQKEACIVLMNSDLAYILATNLIKNAIAYNRADGSINLYLSQQLISISNTGTSLSENTDIFDRYVSKSKDEQSSGLGLSIVKSIANLYNIEISYSYNQQHTIMLKLAKG